MFVLNSILDAAFLQSLRKTKNYFPDVSVSSVIFTGHRYKIPQLLSSMINWTTRRRKNKAKQERRKTYTVRTGIAPVLGIRSKSTDDVSFRMGMKADRIRAVSQPTNQDGPQAKNRSRFVTMPPWITIKPKSFGRVLIRSFCPVEMSPCPPCSSRFDL